MFTGTNASNINPLPVLNVVRNIYCSQETTDMIVDHLERNAKDLLYRCMVDEVPVLDIRNEAYSCLIAYVLDQVSKDIQVSFSDMAMVDLAYEVSRRIRKAYDLPEVAVIGEALAPSIAGPYPNLINLEISDRTHGLGLTQDAVNEILEILYVKHSDIWFSICESKRRNLILFFIEDKLLQFILNNKSIVDILEKKDTNLPYFKNFGICM